MNTKICPSCPPEVGPQPLSNFNNNRARGDGKASNCKRCELDIQRKKRAKRHGYKPPKASKAPRINLGSIPRHTAAWTTAKIEEIAARKEAGNGRDPVRDYSRGTLKCVRVG